MEAFIAREVQDSRQAITWEQNILAKPTSHIASHCRAKPVHTFTRSERWFL